MPHVPVDSFLSLLGNLLLWFSTNGVSLSMLGLSFDLTWMELFVGLMVVSIGAAFLHNMFLNW